MTQRKAAAVCKHCNRPRAEHVDGKCLFEPTAFELHNFFTVPGCPHFFMDFPAALSEASRRVKADGRPCAVYTNTLEAMNIPLAFLAGTKEL